MAMGSMIMAARAWSAPSCSTLALQRIKAGAKSAWQAGGAVALLLGLAAVALQIIELLNLPFQPGSSGFSSVFTGFYPVLAGQLARRDDLAGDPADARSRSLPGISFVEQPPTYAEAFAVQRFQSSLSAFTAHLELPRRGDYLSSGCCSTCSERKGSACPERLTSASAGGPQPS